MYRKINAIILAFIFIVLSLPINFTVLASGSYECSDYLGTIPSGEDTDFGYEAIDSYSSFMKYYFHNLKENHGFNYQGSCGYVAVGMLFAYYDTFHDDRIIPESYDKFFDVNEYTAYINGNPYDMINLQSSPGFGNDIIENPIGYVPTEGFPYYANTLSATEYYNVVESRIETELHSYLISLGHEKGWYKPSNPRKEYCSTTHANLLELIPYYLLEKYPSDNSNQFSGFSTADFTLSSIEKSDAYGNNVKNFVINQIDAGNPVLLALTWGGSGHVVIAYDYEIVNGEIEIFCHFGWGNGSTRKSLNNPVFGGYRSAIVLQWNTPHVCSNNYNRAEIVDGVRQDYYYCYEHKDIITYDHVCSNSIHNYGIETYAITSSSAKYYHKAICHCENVINQSHTVNASGFCTVCSQHVNHNFTYNYKDNNTHVINCSTQNCFYAKTAPHVFDASNLTYCILCKHIVLGGGIGNVGGVFSIELAPLVSVNGSYVLSNGCVVLVEEDKEAYFNDTLQFYPRGEVPQIN
ncbi:MAG: hypothetical protein E7339_01025 [Clostridiales bacterium]|nr:hypothetical protein [Clostridiales bacterium]